MQFDPVKAGENSSMTHHLLIFDVIQKLVTAYISNNKQDFYRATVMALRLTMYGMSVETRVKMSKSLIAIKEEVKQIKNSTHMPEDKQNLIRDLEFSWAEDFSYYAIEAMGHMDMFKVNREGILKLSKYDLETITQAIRSDRGLVKSSEKIKEIPKPEA